MNFSIPQLLLIDKPAGITSFDVIRKLRKKVNGKVPKMGHAGTLDPFATGLLLIGVGSGTKALTELIGLPKTYKATILLGKTTDTLDSDGRVIAEASALHIQDSKIVDVIASLIGIHIYEVPVYSAVKRGGEALYKKAYRGEVVERPRRAMEVFDARCIKIIRNDTQVSVEVVFDVASGTYIRSLAEEVGKKLKIPAMLSGLRRTKIGNFKIEDAKTVENIDFFGENKFSIN